MHSVCLTITLAEVDLDDKVSPPNEPVHFHCNGTGNELSWLLNGEVITKADTQNVTVSFTNATDVNGTLLSDLTIIALPSDDGINIGCLVAYVYNNDTIILSKFFVIMLEVKG